jgi:hypothetical protein
VSLPAAGGGAAGPPRAPRPRFRSGDRVAGRPGGREPTELTRAAPPGEGRHLVRVQVTHLADEAARSGGFSPSPAMPAASGRQLGGTVTSYPGRPRGLAARKVAHKHLGIVSAVKLAVEDADRLAEQQIGKARSPLRRRCGRAWQRLLGGWANTKSVNGGAPGEPSQAAVQLPSASVLRLRWLSVAFCPGRWNPANVMPVPLAVLVEVTIKDLARLTLDIEHLIPEAG